MRRFVLALCLLLGSADVLACGYCVEDKVAAVYDHTSIKQAIAKGHRVAFFAIDGTLEANSGQAAAIERAAIRTTGVDMNGVRVSIDSAALSVSFDPRRSTAERIRQSVQKKLIVKGLSLQLIRIIEKPTDISSPGTT